MVESMEAIIEGMVEGTHEPHRTISDEPEHVFFPNHWFIHTGVVLLHLVGFP